jgi:flagellar protein FliT
VLQLWQITLSYLLAQLHTSLKVQQRSNTLLHYYESLASSSKLMVGAAREGDWNEVFRVEEICSYLIAELNAVQEWESLTDHEERRKRALLRSILADDAEIRNLKEPWLSRLSSWLGMPPPSSTSQALYH